jgi:beta-lactamase class A
MTALADDVRSLCEGGAGAFGAYARNLTTDEIVGFRSDDVFDTASAAKTFVLVHYASLVASGACDPKQRVTLTADDRCLGSGVLRYLEPGLALTLDDLAWLMIIVSDNVATDVIVRTAGGAAAVNAAMTARGMPTARLNPSFTRSPDLGELGPFGTSTPRDLASVYTHLDDRCRAILFRQQFVEGLPRALPHANQASDWGITMPVRVYNKTGGDPGVYTDAGFFETDRATWVASFMAADLLDLTGPNGVGPETAAAFGRLLYDAWGA